MAFKLIKNLTNPILSPSHDHDWENLCVCNPGAWYENGEYFLLYRAAGDDEAHRIHLGLAKSRDGINFVRASDTPVLSPSENGIDGGCVEDPRIVKIDGLFWITYAYRPYPPGKYWTFGPDEVKYPDLPASAPALLRKNMTNTGLLVSKDLLNFRRIGRITRSDLDDRDVILFPERIDGKFFRLHRPKEWIGPEYGTDHPAIWIGYSDDLVEWKESVLLAKGEFDWERKIGGAAPPLRTKDGWLTLYHGVDDRGIYRVGAMMLDSENPRRVISRLPYWIMEPEHDYETKGLYNGCVFPTGNVIAGDRLMVYYGAADRCIGLASCRLDDLLDELRGHPWPGSLA